MSGKESDQFAKMAVFRDEQKRKKDPKWQRMMGMDTKELEAKKAWERGFNRKAWLEVIGVILAMVILGWLSIQWFGPGQMIWPPPNPDAQCSVC